MHVLQNVTEDDRIATWSPAMVEALLRATVGCWEGFAPWQDRNPAVLRLHAQVNHVLPEMPDEDGGSGGHGGKKEAKQKKPKKDKKDKKDKPKKEKEMELGTIEDRKPRLWTAGPFTSIRIERIVPPSETGTDTSRAARSKSPILNQDDETILRPRKRVRSSYRRQSSIDDGTEEGMDIPTAPNTQHSTYEHMFSPLQAALIAQASLPVLKHTQELFPDARTDVTDIDNRSLFHLALQHPKLANDEEKNGGADWICEHLYRPELAAQRVARSQALPLHIALHNRASSRIISTILGANPSSGVDPCRTRDEWYDESPLSLACENGCDFSTVFLLLRADPSMVKGEAQAVVTTT